MKDTDLKTSKQWLKEFNKIKQVVILDPDGWDRSNYDYSFKEELINKDEFEKRLMFSTVQIHRDKSGKLL